MCKILEEEKTIAIDIECENNLHHYGSYISIIQISTKNKNYVVDVIELKEIMPLKKILENNNIQKIFHDVSFDLRILNFEFQIKPKNLFDTQIAALLIGERNVGLGSLLEKFFNVKKESKFQMADWTVRPINPEMMSYAVKDTAYLIQLKDLIETEIKKLGREEWLKEELEHLDEKDYEYRELVFEDMKGITKLTAKEKIFAQKIYDAREIIAKRTNKPIHRIMPNRRIIELAQNPPQEHDGWKKIKGVHPALKAKLETIYYQSKKITPMQTNTIKKDLKKYTEKQKEELQELENIRVKLGEKFNIEPYLIMTKDQVHDIVRNKNYESLRNWQKKLIFQETKLFQENE